MRIYLDFDRTLFDTEALYALLALHGVEEPAHLPPAALRSFPGLLYEDARWYLWHGAPGAEKVVVTYGPTTRQRLKVEHSGTARAVARVHYAGERGKAAFIACEGPQQTFFVDDEERHLLDVRAHHPTVVCLRMRRKGARHCGVPSAFPVVTNWHEAARVWGI